MYDDTTGESASWFALTVRPRFDRAVVQTLESQGFETFLPQYRRRPHHGMPSQDPEVPLFPGYVLCRFDVRRPSRVLETPGVIRILGDGAEPAAVSSREVASLQTAIRVGLPLEPFPFVQTGARMRIERGALAGVEGIVLSSRAKLRLVLSITLLQKSALLEIARDELARPDLHAAAPCDMAKGA
jgi:transcriptional antiterminator NusG